MMEKSLVCAKPESMEVDFRLLFEWVKHNYSFVRSSKILPRDKCLILPYSMVVDGHEDVVTMVAEHHGVYKLDVGFYTNIISGVLSFRCNTNFDSMVRSAVEKNFMKHFDTIEVSEPTERSFRPISRRDFEVVSADCAIPSIDTLRVMPIYRIQLDPKRKFKLPDNPNNVGGVGLAALSHDMLMEVSILSSMSKEARVASQLLVAELLQ